MSAKKRPESSNESLTKCIRDQSRKTDESCERFDEREKLQLRVTVNYIDQLKREAVKQVNIEKQFLRKGFHLMRNRAVSADRYRTALSRKPTVRPKQGEYYFEPAGDQEPPVPASQSVKPSCSNQSDPARPNNGLPPRRLRLIHSAPARPSKQEDVVCRQRHLNQRLQQNAKQDPRFLALVESLASPDTPEADSEEDED